MENTSTANHEEMTKLGEVLGEEYNEALAQLRKHMFLVFAGSLYVVVHVFALWVQCYKRQCGQCGLRSCGWKLATGCVLWTWMGVFLTTCVVLGILSSSTATCSHGILWEYHAIFWVVLMLGKVLELLIYGNVDREMGVLKLLMKLNLGTLAAVDMYTDVIFIVVAHSCGDHRWIWVASTVALVVGVGGGQYFWLGLLQWLRSDRTGGLDYLCRLGHMDVLADLLWDGRQYDSSSSDTSSDGEEGHADRGRRAGAASRSLEMQAGRYQSVANDDEEQQEGRGVEPRGGGELRPEDRLEWHAFWVALSRCLCEDGIQAALQIAFLVLQGQANPVVVASVVAGFLSSCASCCYAVYADIEAFERQRIEERARVEEERGGV